MCHTGRRVPSPFPISEQAEVEGLQASVAGKCHRTAPNHSGRLDYHDAERNAAFIPILLDISLDGRLPSLIVTLTTLPRKHPITYRPPWLPKVQPVAFCT